MTVPVLSAGRPIEPPPHRVGRRTLQIVDPERQGRSLTVEVWFPAASGTEPLTVYELLPGISFESSHAVQAAVCTPGQWPLVVFSHGRTGMRLSYSLLCEALAARGAVVVSADHPGDVLADWLSGQASDDRTNEMNRVADAHLLLRAFLHGHDEVPVDVINAIDHRRVVLAGHSYGAYTALATVAGARGVDAHDRVAGVMVFQPYTRSMSDGLLGRVRCPVVMVVSANDLTTPPAVDADRPWALLPGQPVWRLDLLGAGHQASSDMALYGELAEHVTVLPELMRQYLMAQAAGAGGEGRTWRELLRVHVAAAWAFLDSALGGDEEAGEMAAAELADAPGLALRRR